MSGIMFYGHNGRIEIPLFTGKIDYFIFIVNGFKIFLSYYFKVRENVCLNIIPGKLFRVEKLWGNCIFLKVYKFSINFKVFI